MIVSFTALTREILSGPLVKPPFSIGFHFQMDYEKLTNDRQRSDEYWKSTNVKSNVLPPSQVIHPSHRLDISKQ